MSLFGQPVNYFYIHLIPNRLCQNEGLLPACAESRMIKPESVNRLNRKLNAWSK